MWRSREKCLASVQLGQSADLRSIFWPQPRRDLSGPGYLTDDRGPMVGVGAGVTPHGDAGRKKSVSVVLSAGRWRIDSWDDRRCVDARGPGT